MILQVMQAICTTERTIGFLLNLSIFYYLLRSIALQSRSILQFPMYISSCVSLYLSFSIAVLNFTHIFRDGTLVIVLINPLSANFSRATRDLMFQAAYVLMSLMWTFTPCTCLLQLPHWANSKKLLVSSVFTCVCLIFVAYTVPMIMPSPELELIMEKSMRDLFDIPEEQLVQTYGISVTYQDINDGKSMIILIMLLVAVPYCISYTITAAAMFQIRKILSSIGKALSPRTIKMQRDLFKMQFLQCLLPLVILSIPIAMVTYGAFAIPDLGLATLPMTAFVWLCPVAQSSVQLYYARKFCISPSESNEVKVAIGSTFTTHI